MEGIACIVLLYVPFFFFLIPVSYVQVSSMNFLHRVFVIDGTG